MNVACLGFADPARTPTTARSPRLLPSVTSQDTATRSEPGRGSRRGRQERDVDPVRSGILRILPDAMSALPESTRAGVRDALERSLGRIETALREGRITRDEAEAALEMVREMIEALVDLSRGQLTVVERSGSGIDDNVDIARLRASDHDELVVVTRREADETGEARISLRMVKDDGQEIPSRYRLGLRIDLERRGLPSVDVQFGESALDKRIHGLWRYPDGQLVLTATGAQLADHHFRGVLPSSLANPEEFAAVVGEFRDLGRF